MNKQEKINKLEELKKKAYDLKIEIEYYKAFKQIFKETTFLLFRFRIGSFFSFFI